MHLTSVSHHKCVNIELALTPLIVHVSNLAENSPLLPAHVVDSSNGPHAADIAVGIASIKAVLVVQQDRIFLKSKAGNSANFIQ